VKEKGYTLQGAKEFMKARSAKQSENAEMIASLEKIKSFLTELRDKL
jgi:hypothetical protein